MLTPLETQSDCGDTPLKFQVICPQNGTTVLKGLNGGYRMPVFCPPSHRNSMWMGGGRERPSVYLVYRMVVAMV